MSESSEVKVFVGGHGFDDGRRYFGGEWVKFDGELLETYEREEITYSLYKCTAYKVDDAYRVHVADETNQMSPTYDLYPFEVQIGRRNYDEPYDSAQLADMYPMFAKGFGEFRERLIDPRSRF